MAGVNRAILLGNLGRDPKFAMTAQNMPVCNFTMATTEVWKGEKHTEWHSIRVFGKQAEACRDYLKKGSLVYIEGRWHRREGIDRDKNKRLYVDVVADRVTFLGSPISEASHPMQPTSEGRDGAARDAPAGEPPEDDIPF